VVQPVFCQFRVEVPHQVLQLQVKLNRITELDTKVFEAIENPALPITVLKQQLTTLSVGARSFLWDYLWAGMYNLKTIQHAASNCCSP